VSDDMTWALYEKCHDCHLFVVPNEVGGEGIAEYVHLTRGDAADDLLDSTHDPRPSGMLATLPAWRVYGPPAMRARFAPALMPEASDDLPMREAARDTFPHDDWCHPDPDRDPYVGCECGAMDRWDAFAKGAGWQAGRATPREDVLRSSLSTWLTLALDEPGRLFSADLIALRDWIDGGLVGEMPLPKNAVRRG
jgi:hypothetical protein